MNDVVDRPPPLIVSAASRLPDGLVIVSPRHNDAVFVAIVERLAKAEGKHPLESDHDVEGFVDQYRTFYTREEAWVIAEARGQIRHKGNWGEGVLYSENLY